MIPCPERRVIIAGIPADRRKKEKAGTYQVKSIGWKQTGKHSGLKCAKS